MGSIVAAWPKVALSEVMTPVDRAEVPVAGKAYRQAGVRLWGQGAYERESVDGSATQYQRLSRIETDDIIVNKIWARNGSVSVVSPEVAGCYVSGEFPTFAPMRDKLNPQWFKWLTRTQPFWEQCDEQSRGTSGKNRIRPEKFLEILIPLPSLDDQRRIVARIEELAARIEEARGLRREAMAEAAIQFGATVSATFSRGEADGWEICSLGDYVIDDCYGTSEKTSDDLNGTPILRMGNIQDGRLDVRDLKYLYLTPSERAKLLLKKGDILVNRTNSAELVGKCAVFDVVDGEFGFASYLIRLRLDMSRALPELIAAYINSPAGRAYMFNERKQMTGQANVNATTLKALPVALPSLEEQQAIWVQLRELRTSVDALEKFQSQTGREIDALLPSVLDKAFRGEL